MRRLVAILGAACLMMAGCSSPGGGGASPPPGGPRGTIVVGVSGAFAENQIVAELYAQVLERAGYTVQREFDLRSREISQNALESGQIDVKPEYLSSLLLFVERNARGSEQPGPVAGQLRQALDRRGLSLLTPSPAQDTNQFVANAKTARTYDLSTMSSLAPVAGRLTLGGPPECAQRPFCLPGLARTYGILFDDFTPLDAGGPQTVAALRDDSVQIGLLFSTDPSIRANGFVPLVDDRHLQNAENITPVIRKDRLNPEIAGLLDEVSARLTTERVTELVGRVVIDRRSVAEVAREFLTANGLVSG